MKLLLFFLLTSATSFSQDIAGLWKGTLYNDTTQLNLYYEIAIFKVNGKYTGYSYTTFSINNQEMVGVKSIKVIRQKERFILQDVELLFNNYPVAPPKGVRQISSVSISNKNTAVLLSGEFITTRTREYGRQVTETITLQKTDDLEQTKLIVVLDKLGVANPGRSIKSEAPFQSTVPTKVTGNDVAIGADKKQIPAANVGSASSDDNTTGVKIDLQESRRLPNKKLEVVGTKAKSNSTKSEQEVNVLPTKSMKVPTDPLKDLVNRRVETIETVYFTSDSLQLALYDNGYVDGDSVSIIVNGTTILQHQLLSTQAITKTIYTPKGITDSVNIIMYAENLGSIGPNTGLLIIFDGDKRYEITFSGDLKKNSDILLNRKN